MLSLYSLKSGEGLVTPGQKNNCISMIKKYGLEQVERAFRIADEQDKHSLAYVRGILTNPDKQQAKPNLKENRKIGA